MALLEINVPDIGDFDEVTVIELMVKPGDTVKAEQSLITVESDKASMEIPSSAGGVVKELKVALGDKVKQGSLVLVLEVAGEAAAAPATTAVSEPKQAAAPAAPAQAATNTVAAAPAAASGPVEVRVPDIGDFKDVAVIELLVKVGDTVKPEQSLITVESDKASMEIPSSTGGVVKEIRVKLGDKMNIGDVVLVLEGSTASAAAAPVASAPAPAAAAPAAAPAAVASAPAAPAAAANVPAHNPTVAPTGSCPTPRLRCASSPASWVCRWTKSKAAASRAVSPSPTSRASPSPSWPAPRRPRLRRPRHLQRLQVVATVQAWA